MVWRERIIRERREMTNIPKDPVMLLSYINTQLRDNYRDLDDLCDRLDVSKTEIQEKLGKIGYSYKEELHQFK